jgi:hypothetical protein
MVVPEPKVTKEIKVLVDLLDLQVQMVVQELKVLKVPKVLKDELELLVV